MMLTHKNLFDDLRWTPIAEPRIDALWRTDQLRIGRIVTWGHSTPPGEWCTSDTDEWIVVISGAACVRTAGSDQDVDLGPGDWLLLPAGTRHRVEWTDPDRATMWLAIRATAKLKPGRN